MRYKQREIHKKVMRALILGLYPARYSEYLLNMHLLLLLIDAIIIAALTAVNIYTSALSTRVDFKSLDTFDR